MSRYDRQDIVLELLELAKEIRSDIMNQLAYYRASVYKLEAQGLIDKKVAQLQFITQLLFKDDETDAFADYEQMKKQGLEHAIPGECLQTQRLLHLFQELDRAFALLNQEPKPAFKQEAAQLTKQVQRHRRQLLALCRQGSPQWSFFSTL